ncbi:odorant receptor 131-2-like [Denticeps clupeoides]|uniref:odorant receptor 131-2-like n=1 Tax=Denticeps clupeoides TaxID=299321 RepID=UPI0010A47B42|nr:odorant receptor 131-2-like [Denticeps clupeoides]XP_028855573.1 odorant receptor 131-2-like [Denticeps clupeoides]XP_028855574.1 odorant receptor 131-2-like [Denticeps clupeoides]XP_028855575.1 odorant receptor 131-2-like [Denticeps clupeoides]XP_028855576.1 odorant receptor 131-2-like [Denticeps clupeoides]XP_028855577.1 odorant receptor 131-2-like [Denticeps clupeoides]XP_028855579.1 odorant receptor 131-2-like [Denticeps clupeoides]XP_028855580.1 odorant receptor 131-2-like [Denticeps
MQNSTAYGNLRINSYSMSTGRQRFEILQIVVVILLYINCLMMFTFLKKEAFRSDTRYVLFAQTLFIDSSLILLSDLALTGVYFQLEIHFAICCIFALIMKMFIILTPLTLVAMCLERYVAICMPLRHADISTPRTRTICILLVWIVSAVLPLFMVISSAFVLTPRFLFTYVVCSAEVMFLQSWQSTVQNILLQLYFVTMFGVILFTYIMIMKAAKKASADKKKSTHKGLRTVILHGLQLLLTMVQFICPYYEAAALEVSLVLFVNIRYADFIVFVLAPRCLSPLVYGIRDEKFFTVLRNYALFGLYVSVSRCVGVTKQRSQAKTKPLEM